VKGFTQKKPSFLTVPKYLPKRVSTFDSLGFTITKPGNIKAKPITAYYSANRFFANKKANSSGCQHCQQQYKSGKT
jgi:predicted membrane-bound spermidine synthase